VRFKRLLFGPLFAWGLVAMACSEASRSPLAPEEGNGSAVSARVSKSHDSVELVYCKPFKEASQTATIGLRGGTITVGPHSLWIPPGALLTPRTITARIAKNDYTHSVQFSPAGLQFAVPALLTLSYSGCDRHTLLQQLEVVYTSDSLDRILELLPSVNDPSKQTTTGVIRHFSRYAVAY
jgi:hypothetical protein